MREVSAAWKAAQKQNFLPESFVEITLNVGDPDSQADARTSDNGQMSFSRSSALADGTDRTPKQYALLERNLWLLDGAKKILTPTGPYDNEGYIGTALSNDYGVFDGVIPSITISFSKVFTELIPGITITWGTAHEEYAKKFRITASANGTQTYQGEFMNGGELTSVATADIDHYDKIVIEILEWCLPGRRARIESILIGIEKTYTKKELMSYEHSMLVDPLSASLPKSEIVFVVKNLDGEYNPDNPRGAEKYLMERQAIAVRYGYKLDGVVEWIEAGTFFMSEWETPQNGITATFTARDSLEYMTDLYTSTSSGTLMAIATAALNQAGLPVLPDGSNRWILDSSLSGITAASGADLSEYTIQEVLQMVANAACCVFYQDRDGIIRIEPLATGETDYEINRFNSYENSEMELTKQLKAVDINDGMYVHTVGKVGETQRINNPLISSAQAATVAQWVANYLVNRKILSGEFRTDPRIDTLDRVINQNRFAENIVLVTEVQFTYNGAFKGTYEGRAGV